MIQFKLFALAFGVLAMVAASNAEAKRPHARRRAPVRRVYYPRVIYRGPNAGWGGVSMPRWGRGSCNAGGDVAWPCGRNNGGGDPHGSGGGGG